VVIESPVLVEEYNQQRGFPELFVMPQRVVDLGDEDFTREHVMRGMIVVGAGLEIAGFNPAEVRKLVRVASGILEELRHCTMLCSVTGLPLMDQQ
jgi:hypothetical protein